MEKNSECLSDPDPIRNYYIVFNFIDEAYY